jgi:ATP-binding cassette subfamily B protein
MFLRRHRDPSAEAPPLVRLWRYARGHRRTVVAAMGFSVLNKLADVMPELLIGAAVDVVVRGNDSLVATALGVEDRFAQLVVLAIINVVVWLIESASEFVANVLWRNLAQTIEHEARMDAYRHVQRLELAWFEDQSTGGLLSILNDDVNQLERFLDVGANELVRTFVNVVFVGVVFFVAEPVLGVVAFLPIPLIVWGSIRYQRRLEPRYTVVRQAAGDLGALLANNVSGIATIRAFTAEARESERVAAASGDYREANREAIRLSSAFIPLIRLAILAAFTLTLLIGGRSALNGTLEVGVFSVLVYMTQRLLWPLTRLGETFDLYQRAMASTRRIMDLLAVDPTIVDGVRTLPEPVRGEVRFESLRFAYGPTGPTGPTGPPGPSSATTVAGNGDGDRRRRPVLDGFDLVVPPGETHAIVGATGAGKSTVVKLLLRLYDATTGRVALDGVDVRDVPLAELRRAIGYVGQDVFLFQGTVRENLAYGRPDAGDAELERAARLAEAQDFIAELPDGYDTVVGERGQKLSGGQRQRLSIARAILKDPPVLVLDEATSAVDNETEAAIQRSLELVGRDRTVIVIAHRLSTIRHADRIHVLEAGRIVESGSHDELVADRGLYAALWRIQTGEVHALRPTA